MKTETIKKIAESIDAEAQEVHINSGGSIQGWDCQYTIEPGGILHVDGQEIDLSKATMGEVVTAIRGCYAVLDCQG